MKTSHGFDILETEDSVFRVRTIKIIDHWIESVNYVGEITTVADWKKRGPQADWTACTPDYLDERSAKRKCKEYKHDQVAGWTRAPVR